MTFDSYRAMRNTRSLAAVVRERGFEEVDGEILEVDQFELALVSATSSSVLRKSDHGADEQNRYSSGETREPTSASRPSTHGPAATPRRLRAPPTGSNKNPNAVIARPRSSLCLMDHRHQDAKPKSRLH